MKYLLLLPTLYLYYFFFHHKKETCIWIGENPPVIEKGTLNGKKALFGYRLATVIESEGIYVTLRYETLFHSSVRWLTSNRREQCQG